MHWRQYAFPAAILGIAAIVGIVILIVNSGGDGGSSGNAGSGSNGGGCKKQQVRQVAPGKVRKPSLRLDPAKTYRATVQTNCGTFVIQLDPKQAPVTGGSFVTLVRKGFYNGLGFHRIAPGFVIQGGDPLNNGQGGPGYLVRERPPRDAVYSKGVVAMAKGGNQPAGTSGSQFFVVTGADAGLPPDYALLGKVISGMKAVQAIESKATAQDGPPSQPIIMNKVTVAVGAGRAQ